MAFTLSRRSLLRGAAGIAVALPALEIMAPRRAAAGPGAVPKRFTMSFAATSTGDDNLTTFIEPANTGFNYTTPRALQSLVDLGVKDNVSVVTGLKVPWDTGSGVPPGGRPVQFHYNNLAPNVAGTRGGTPSGPTADQIVADMIAGSTPQRVLAYRAQPVDYLGSSDPGPGGRMSWRMVNGNLTAVDPISSPRVAYESLFSGFTPTNPAQIAQAQALLRQRKSVLDFVGNDTQSLMARLGQADRMRMQQHLDQIRGLEQRLDMVAPVGQATCKLLPNPGADPPLGDVLGYGYSGEDHRSDLMSDFIAMAFACDMSRVASFMFTTWKCYMLAYPVTPYQTDVHSITHNEGAGSSSGAIGDSVGWFVTCFARLVKKLKAIPEVDGTTVLDNSACVLLFEGGHGYNPEAPAHPGAHSTENMTVLIAGGAGGLKPGQHVVATGKHPANVVLSAMHAVGVDKPLGDVNGYLPELFV
jgi:hypothetical protein